MVGPQQESPLGQGAMTVSILRHSRTVQWLESNEQVVAGLVASVGEIRVGHWRGTVTVVGNVCDT